MDKKSFFDSCKRKTVTYAMPDGNEVNLLELTLEQRGKLQEMVKSDPIKAQAAIVAMSCDVLDESDIDNLMQLPGTVINDMADTVLGISGLADEEEEKN